MKSLLTVLKEQINSFYLVRRLSLYEVKSQNNNNYLGILWELINPMIQIAVYFFVFGFILQRGDVAPGIKFFPWLIAGMSVWFFLNQGMLQGTKSVYTRIRMVAKMSFPMSVIPTYVIIAKFYQHLMLLAAVAIILQFIGFPVSITYIQIPYYMFAAIVFVFAFSLITSTLATIVRDVTMVVQSFMRVLIYLTPILWPTNKLEGHDVIQFIIKLNPLYYIVEGYRSSLLGNPHWFAFEYWHYTLYFWAVVLVMLLIGSMLHIKFRDHFIDYL
ncbi:ABC transporter permease [Camelliibacillus cellulosilyticus]|uniref:Transport permease protein n=1 Tax=Camelliibacillus cellulosilyticus TaxID=2174486 RepID=A0ABV9GTG2_9BACL